MDRLQEGTEEINRKLDVLIKLLAYRLVAEMTVTQGAPILRRLGLKANEIAEVYETTPNVINVRLTEAKRKKKG